MINGRWKDGNKPEVDVTHLRTEAERTEAGGWINYYYSAWMETDGYCGLDWCNSRIEQLKRERDRLREALKLYANKRLWHRNGHGWLCVFRGDTNGPAIALAALQEAGDE